MTLADFQEWARSPQVAHALNMINKWAGVIGLVAFTLALVIHAWREGK